MPLGELSEGIGPEPGPDPQGWTDKDENEYQQYLAERERELGRSMMMQHEQLARRVLDNANCYGPIRRIQVEPVLEMYLRKVENGYWLTVIMPHNHGEKPVVRRFVEQHDLNEEDPKLEDCNDDILGIIRSLAREL